MKRVIILVTFLVACASDGRVYTPYVPQTCESPIASADSIPWAGADFEAQDPGIVECSNSKEAITNFDVTAGCLTVVKVGTYNRGQVKLTDTGYFRALALGYAPWNPNVAKWTDSGTEYRFYHKGKTGEAGNPGFKAFIRYQDEDNLYVASWRFDGVVQIQEKKGGVYRPLVIFHRNYPAPTPNVWHKIKFEAKGNLLTLYLDGTLIGWTSVPETELFTWGTAGIRIDSADGTFIDDWRVFTP